MRLPCLLSGESRSTFAVIAGDDELVVKLVQGAIGNQWRLVRLVGDLRRRGYPAPEYVGVGESDGTIFTVQRRLPGQILHRGPGRPPGCRSWPGATCATRRGPGTWCTST